MRIVCDERKRLANIEKHEMDFATLDMGFFASAIFRPDHSGHTLAIGARAEEATVAVVVRPLASEAMSIISMRRASAEEGDFSMTKQKQFVPGRGDNRADWDEVSDNPEWTAEDICSAKPMSKAFPDLHASLIETLRKRGPVRTKTPISIRLDSDIVEKLRASGPGWQSRTNDALRAFVERKA